ncbi:MAG: hypothetical protein NC399_04240 [Muribaculum sp.]|nr:hypothetical protein [Muribaculum sp.]
MVEPLPELVSSEWYDRKVQIYDMVFTRDECLTEEDIREIAEGSAYDVELVEAFDEKGAVCLEGLMLDGKKIVDFVKKGRYRNDVSGGTIEYGDYYHFENKQIDLENNWYDKAIMEVEALDFKTRDEVLAYLAGNGFVEAVEEQEPYISMNKYNGRDYVASYVSPVYCSGIEYADVPHYYCKGAQSITFYRIHKVSENNQEIEFDVLHYSGIHLNLVESVSIEFNTDGTISSMSEPEVQRVLVMGEYIG